MSYEDQALMAFCDFHWTYIGNNPIFFEDDMNPMCDGGHCKSEAGEVRVLPLNGDSNLILCHACFDHEIRGRRDRNKRLSQDAKFDLPAWDSLMVYGA